MFLIFWHTGYYVLAQWNIHCMSLCEHANFQRSSTYNVLLTFSPKYKNDKRLLHVVIIIYEISVEFFFKCYVYKVYERFVCTMYIKDIC